jgi:hypothetical protein
MTIGRVRRTARARRYAFSAACQEKDDHYAGECSAYHDGIPSAPVQSRSLGERDCADLESSYSHRTRDHSKLRHIRFAQAIPEDTAPASYPTTDSLISAAKANKRSPWAGLFFQLVETGSAR